MRTIKPILLVLPLLVLAILSFMIENWTSNSKGFFLNLATEIVGIVVTITYVDWILHQQKVDEWKEVSELVRVRIQHLIELSLYIFSETPSEMRKRGEILIPFEPYDLDELAHNPIRKVGLYVTLFVFGRKAAYKLIDNYGVEKWYLDIPQKAKEFVSSLKGNSWKQFYGDVKSIVKETENLIDLFGNRISARQFRYLLESQVSAQRVSQILEHYGDVIAGVITCEAIGKKPEFANELKQELSNLLAKLYQDLTDLANDLHGKKMFRKQKRIKL